MQFLRADRVFNGVDFLPNESVLIIDEHGALHDILDVAAIDPGKIQTLKGVICPGFVNAHCHTELSHLKNKIPQKTGLAGFGKQIIFQRNTSSKEEIKEKIKQADNDMWINGIVAVGDICNTDDSLETKTQSKIHYHSFIELLGLHPDRAALVFEAGVLLYNQIKGLGLNVSLAPHAPYSTSKDLIEKISAFNSERGLPSSIHNQETEDETKFFHGIENGFYDLYKFLQLDISWFKAPMMSSLKYYLEALGSQRTILVHNSFSTKEDIELASKKNVYWCFCPNANKYIEDRLPGFDLFTSLKNRICLGTDSLASNTQLDLVREADLFFSNSGYSEEDVLRSMTSIPAEALGIQDEFGKLIKGKNAGLNLIEFKNRNIRFVKKLIP
ncbi:MAG: amidohydrolase [Bacteroidetes bacterium]|jgi:cytosine/adenosine deaminase-related metal-dependent hydrolase|nr:amidohydrolase [Bacteroidota bacterium]